MKQAISVRYLSSTNCRGSRLKAVAQAKSKTVPWDFELCVDANYEEAAKALCRSLGWPESVTGGMLDDRTAVFLVNWEAGQ